MANTSIQLKKSGVSGNVPASLNFGELALNYSDGKLYYKNASGGIVSFSSAAGGNSFATINVAGSLILASSNNDILSFANGGGHIITGNTTSKTITISSVGYQGTLAPFSSNTLSASNFGYAIQLSANATLPLASSMPAGAKINFYSQGTYTISVSNQATEFIYSGTGSIAGTSTRTITLYEGETLELTTRGGTEWDVTGGTGGLKFQPVSYAKSLLLTSGAGGSITFPDGSVQTTAASGASSDSTARNLANSANVLAQAAFNEANSANILAQAAYTQANSGTTLASGAYTLANTADILAQAAFNTANTASSNIVYLQGIETTQNTNITAVNTFAQSAYNKANNALANTGSLITTNGSSQLVITNTTASTSNTTGALVVDGGLGVNGNVVSNMVYTGDVILGTAIPVGGSGVFSGSDYLTVNSFTGYPSGTSDFTIESWVYLSNISVPNPVIFGTSSNSLGFSIGVADGASTAMGLVYVGVAWEEYCNYSFAANTWYHVAACRTGGQIYFFVNGVQQTTLEYGGSPIATNSLASAGNAHVGAYETAAKIFNGSMSNLRVINGTALYTTNFTPSTTPLTAVSGTQLLLNMGSSGTLTTDSSTNNYSITNNGGVTFSSSSPFPGLSSLVDVATTLVAQNTYISNANTFAQGAYNKANSANVLAQIAFNQANSSNVLAQAAFNQANSANVLAQASFNKANTSLQVSSGAAVITYAGQTSLEFTDGTVTNYIVSENNGGTGWGGSGSLNLLTYQDNPIVFFQNQVNAGSIGHGQVWYLPKVQVNTSITFGDTTVQTTAASPASYSQAAFGLANTASANTIYLQGIENTQNSNITAAFNAANTAGANTVYLQGIENTQNTTIQTVYNTANTGYNFINNGGTITGNVAINGSLSVSGNIVYTGNVTTQVISGNTGEFFGYASNGFNALYAGIPSGYFIEPQIVYQISSNYNGYAGAINIQNINPGSNASSDLFISADNGTINDGFLDLGLGSSTYNYPGYTLIKPNDGYLFTTGNTITGGGNMIVGTGYNNDVVFATGGINTSNEIARFKYNTGLVLKNLPITFADGSSQNTAFVPAKQAGIDAYQNTTITNVNTLAQAAFNKANAGISSSNTFVTINANSTLINATSNTDTLTILPGNNISFSTNATSKTITINSSFATVNIPAIYPTRTSFVAASAQSSIAITHTVPFVYVSINGITVDPSEYTPNGTYVVLNTALRTGDVVDVTGYLTGANAVPGIVGPQGPAGASYLSNTVIYTLDNYVNGNVYIKGVQLANINSTLTVSGVTDIVANNVAILSTLSTHNTAINLATANTVYLQGGLNSANANLNAANANISLLFGIENTQNTNIALAWNAANTFALYTQGVDNTQNTNITLALTTANNALANVDGTLFNGSLNIANSLGVGTAPSGVVGEIRAANNITAYYTSDRRYKENIINIPDALNKVDIIGGKLFDWTNDYLDNHGGEDGYFLRKNDFGVIAQDVQSVFPVAVRTKPDGSLAVDYEKLSALAFAAIRELKKEIDELKGKI